VAALQENHGRVAQGDSVLVDLLDMRANVARAHQAGARVFLIPLGAWSGVMEANPGWHL
jgi:predicted S18 family serine protease